MSLGQYLPDWLAWMQLDCPVLAAPALAGTIDDEGVVVSEQGQSLIAETDELSLVAVLSNN